MLSISALFAGVVAAWESMERRPRSLTALDRFWTTQQWYLLYGETNDGVADPSALKALEPPARTFWADPFVVLHEGRRFVFFEEYRYRFWGRTQGGKGTIAAVEYRADGTWGERAIVLERDYHLSYPFVFRWQGRHYMLPETSVNHTVELYEEVEFPWKWSFCRTLMERVAAMDSTLHQSQDLWWMFTCLESAGARNRDLYLYSSVDPVAGQWQPHPANPIVSDHRCARPAGALFFDGHHWIRPSQDCSSDYGSAVEFRRILRLDEEAYIEEPAGRLGPETIRGAAGIHTWNGDCGLLLADARRRVARWRLCWGSTKTRSSIAGGAMYMLGPWLQDVAQLGLN